VKTSHTGSHKINNALGQVLLARRMGKHRIIAETGAGQHGVARLRSAPLRLGVCHLHGAEDMRRQALNVFRMRLMGAEVRSVEAGAKTLKDAINEALRDWVTTCARLITCWDRRSDPILSHHGARVSARHRRRGAGPGIGSRGAPATRVVACVGGGSKPSAPSPPFSPIRMCAWLASRLADVVSRSATTPRAFAAERRACCRNLQLRPAG